MKERSYSKVINIAQLLTLVALFFSLIIYIQSSAKYFAGYDSYYHVRISWLISQQGPLKEFPWLQFSVLKDNFVDDHFLFHLYLIPFIKIFDVITGPKIAIVLIQIMVIAVFYLLLKSNKIILPAIWTFIFITFPAAFWWRVNLIRAEGMLLFMLMVFIWLLFRSNKLWLLSIWSFFYVWAGISSCFYLVIFVLLYALSQKLTGRQLEVKKIIFVFLGLFLGIIINPYFPQNTLFAYRQVIIAGLIRKVSYAMELRPYDTWTFLRICSIPLTLWCLGIIVSFFKKKHDERSIFMVLLSIMFMVLVFKHQRFITYYLIFALLAASFMLQDFLIKLIKVKGHLNKYIKILLSLFILFFFVYLSRTAIGQAGSLMHPAFNIKDLRGALDYIKKNSSPGDVVFHDDWDKFPYLFFFDYKNYYITGMDPSFMEQYDEAVFKKYNCLVTNDQYINIKNERIDCSVFPARLIKVIFGARWVLVDRSHHRLQHLLDEAKEYFRLVYQQGTFSVYEVN